MKTTQNILSSSLIFWVLLAGAVGGGMVGCTNSDIAVSKSGKLTVSDEKGYLFSQLAAGGIEEKCINLSNREDAPGDVTITKLEIEEGTGRREFRISKVHGQPFKGKFDKISLQPGEETTVCVEYIPNDSARDSASLVVSVEGDSSLEEGKYTVNISSESTAPILGIPLTVRFPGVLSTEWQCRTQAVSNLGLEKLKINHVSLDDRNRYFHVQFFDSKPSKDCPPGPTRFGGKSVDDVLKEYGGGAPTLSDKVLGSRGSDDAVMWVRYFFMPSAVNSAEASLIFQTNQLHDGGKVTVALSGNTSDVCIESIPSPVDFNEATKTYPQKRSVKITNCSQGKAQKVVKIGNIFLDQAGSDFALLTDEPTTSEEVKTLLQAATPTPIQLEPQKSIIVDAKFAPMDDPKDSGGDLIEGAIVLGLEGSETSSVKIPMVGKNVKELKPIARIQAKVELAEDIKKNKLTAKNQYSQSILMRNTDELQFDTASSFVPKGYKVTDHKWMVSYLPKDANDQAIKAIEGSRFGSKTTTQDWNKMGGNPRLKIPVAGQYVFTYQICVQREGDPSSPKVCSDSNDFRSRVSVEVRSDEPIHIQLTWYSTKGTADTRPKTTGADLDLLLSYKGAYWSSEQTCSHKQPDVRFGHNGRMKFERDDRDGDGPESISVSGPTGQDTFYIGVQQYESHGWAETWATLTVYVYGRKYWSTTFSPPPRKFTSVGESSRPFWVVASVQWRAAGGSGPASPLIRVIDSFVSSTPEANKVLQRYTKRN